MFSGLGGGGASTAAEISYDNTSSGLSATDVQAAIDEAVGLSGGMPAAINVTYDNTASGLTATDVQAAIDEIISKGKVLGSMLCEDNTLITALPIVGQWEKINANGVIGTNTTGFIKINNNELQYTLADDFPAILFLSSDISRSGTGTARRAFELAIFVNNVRVPNVKSFNAVGANVQHFSLSAPYTLQQNDIITVFVRNLDNTNGAILQNFQLNIQ